MEKLISLYIDSPIWENSIEVDDFIIAVGKIKSNSVYHIAEVKSKQSPKHKKLWRYYVKCYRSDLITALKRDPNQRLISMQWYSRNKKNNV
ncbi:hypothetical protein C7S20_19400 [Christiangramia fulva]|uniref:Uncharacterized protein n=1 Tax=Christiangramia fulva TaxID=2126553 RepID=A0A2R3ZAP5_9FLAO|nr:hypothetical protein [Christiangramia fulva]AVR47242.1 hypothetical protein C7S20_19400 [Christiangramia fulva]